MPEIDHPTHAGTAPSGGHSDHTHHEHDHASHEQAPAAHSHEHGEHEHTHGAQAHAHDQHDHTHDGRDAHVHETGGHTGLRGWLESFFHIHGHDHDAALSAESILETSAQGIRALAISLVSLFITAGLQIVIVFISGSVALLADTIHNFADASTAIPLWMAFALNRRNASRGFTYRYGKAEDLAGAFVVLVIAFSAGLVLYESFKKLLNPVAPSNLGWVAAAAVIGFLGNEVAAWVRIRTGRRIGSAALVADGMHARVDGLTSLAVLVGTIGVWLGFPLADPIVGLLIGVAILFILRDSVRTIWQRLMDAVDPQLVDTMEETALAVPGVEKVKEPRLRWIGHALWGELLIEVDGDLPTTTSHQIAEEVRHALFHALPRLRSITVHVDPRPNGHPDPNHQLTAHHGAT
jgi:cation diffusion facilitator family transporter